MKTEGGAIGLSDCKDQRVESPCVFESLRPYVWPSVYIVPPSLSSPRKRRVEAPEGGGRGWMCKMTFTWGRRGGGGGGGGKGVLFLRVLGYVETWQGRLEGRHSAVLEKDDQNAQGTAKVYKLPRSQCQCRPRSDHFLSRGN